MILINTIRRICVCSAALALTGILIVFHSESAEYCTAGIRLCIKTLVPALFPFFVLNGVLMHYGFPYYAGKLCAKPFGRLFGMRGECGAAVLTGFLTGFPSGPAAAATLFDNGIISRDEGERLLPLCSAASPAFVIGGVGAMLGNIRAGAVIWAAQLAAAVICGIVFRKNKKKNKPPSPAPGVGAKSAPDNCYPPSDTGFSASGAFAAALKEGAFSMLAVCGTVVFFSVLSGFVLSALSAFPDSLSAAAAGILEITSGVKAAAGLGDKASRAVFAALGVGWSGFSVHMQTEAVCGGRFSMKKYYAGKLLTAALTGAIVYVCTALFL